MGADDDEGALDAVGEVVIGHPLWSVGSFHPPHLLFELLLDQWSIFFPFASQDLEPHLDGINFQSQPPPSIQVGADVDEGALDAVGLDVGHPL